MHRHGQKATAQILQSAWVGDMRAARSAGKRPATAPIRTAAPKPPPRAGGGTTIAHPFVEAYTAVEMAPKAIAVTRPITDSSAASERNCNRIWPLVAPRARRSP